MILTPTCAYQGIGSCWGIQKNIKINGNISTEWVNDIEKCLLTNIYFFKVNKRNTKKRCEIYSN